MKILPQLQFLLFLATLVSAVYIPSTFSSSELAFLHGDPKATHRAELTIAKDMVFRGTLSFALFGEEVPQTVENFAALVNMTKGFGYDKVKFHRIVKDFVVQGGDFERQDGTGGYSIFGKKFPDEKFSVLHNKKGRLLMANLGPNTNGAQFFITTTKDCPWLDGKHVVFGQLIGGMDILEEMNNVELDDQGKPTVDYVIVEGKSSPVDLTRQMPYEEAKKAEELEQAALRGETTLLNDQVHEVKSVSDSMGGFIFMGGFCLVVLLLWRLTRGVRRNMGVKFK